eukprot:m51a1_g8835 hypothetical protein (1703) ;mRNA; r:403593-413484
MRPHLFVSSALLVALLVVAGAAASSSGCDNSTDIVVGQSAGSSQIEQGAAEGLRAAIAEAAKLTRLPLRLVQLNHSTEAQLIANVKTLVEEECAFMIAATTASSEVEDTLLSYLQSSAVPFVGSLSASTDLRDIDNLTASFKRSTSTAAAELPFVVNVRASGVDELNAVLSELSEDWSTLSEVSFVAHTMAYDYWAYNYVNSSLAVLTGSSGLLSSVFLGTSYAPLASPKAIIVCTTPNTTAQFVSQLAQSSHTDIAVYLVSWSSPEDLDVRLTSATRALLAANGIDLFFTQNMPDPEPSDVSDAIPLKATPKEDQRLIKEEVLLLHKHHHPNLLMLMGYCETKTELLVVTEYMEGGTLSDYLVREKRYLDMDAKGTVKVSDFWFSNRRGALSSSGSGKALKRAAWQPPEVIAGTILTPATDVYAFGIVLWELIAPPEMTLTSSSSLGAFEIPQDLMQSVGSTNGGLFSQNSNNSGGNTRYKPTEFSGDDGASMVSFMPIKEDSVSLQVPQNSSRMDLTPMGLSHVTAEPAMARAASGNATGIVIGQSAGRSEIEKGAAEGLRAAIREAAMLTRLPLKLVQYNHTTEEEMGANVKKLVEEDCAFMIAATTATSSTESTLLKYLKSAAVPLVGSLSASTGLRDIDNLTASFRRSTSKDKVTLPFVVNVRASGVDELNAVMSVLSQDWGTLTQVSFVAHKMDYDYWAYNYVNSSLAGLTGSSGLLSAAFLGTSTLSSAELSSAMSTLFTATASPKAIIVCTTPNTTAQFVSQLAQSSHTDIAVYLVSWSSPEDLDVRLTSATRALLAANGIDLFFTQNMPDPEPSDVSDAIPLVRKFTEAGTSYTSRSALEGYLVGWFIHDALHQAAERYSSTPTRGDFLYTVFADIRTFDVQGTTLGPYGDGGLSGSPQAGTDACNQGLHEVYMTQYSATNKTQEQLSGSTLKFAGCSAPEWSSDGTVTLVGSTNDPANTNDDTARSGVLAAVNVHNSGGGNTVLLRSTKGNISAVAKDLESSKVVAVAIPTISSVSDASSISGVAFIAPIPGLWGLHYPFVRRVVNLFPSAYDESVAAFMFFASKEEVTNLAVLQNDNSEYTKQCVTGIIDYASKNITHNFTHTIVEGVVDAATYIIAHKEYNGFFILGGGFNVHDISGVTAYRLLNSQVVPTAGSGVILNTTAKNVTYRLSVSPPLLSFASTSSIRTEYSTWVSSSDQDDVSFRSFFVGKFLAAVIDVAKASNPNKTLTADSIIDAVYSRSVFTIGGVQIGPFQDSCSSDSRDCNNQGLSTIYVVKGIIGQKISRTYVVGNYGRDYKPADKAVSTTDNKHMITVEFFNIHKGEIELGKCLGHGRFGSMYMADWHGTTVAVRVIDKKATPKEDQRLIKEEVLLLHKHHHPNLLMLMGYCETKTELLVVTEYMEGGTLSDYLVREKRYAEDVLKGIAYLHSCKPPIVHGSISTRNLLLDVKGTVKVSDFWFSSKKGAFSSGSGKTLKRAAWQPPEVIAGTFLTPATDVYAFGIVLWELIAPPEMTLASASACSTATASDGSSPAVTTSGMLSAGLGGVVEMNNTQLGPPEIPPNTTPEVADLLERCWQTQPERRPSIFQILRNWPTTFADLIQSAGSGSGGLFMQPLSSGSNNPVKQTELSADAASMVSFMPLRMDSVALQVPQDSSQMDFAGAGAPSDAPAKARAASGASSTRARHGSAGNN